MATDKQEFKDTPEKDLEPLIDQAVKRGAVYALYHVDAHGANEQLVRDALVGFVARLTQEEGIVYARGEIEKAIEENKVYSCCAEVKILGEDLSALLRVALKYGPVAVEILKPHKRELTAIEMQDILLDASMTAQEYSKYVLTNVVTPEKRADLEERLRRRAEFGKELREKAEKK